jgi:hypothetical protein
MHLFGSGLVLTENDFGYQGTPPTHPELLDWLAEEFRTRQSWSVKGLIRTIVTSATYRQASDVRPELRTADPNNSLLGRQNRLRIDAEVVRDAILSASGALYPAIGGPSVFPPQPDGVYAFTQTPKKWPTSTGGNRFRRSLYTTFFRSAPYPLLTTFDAPDCCSTCTRRTPSNTPLQALAVANDLSFHELAERWAQRIQREMPVQAGWANQLRWAFRSALAREPNSAEIAIMERFWTSQRANKDEPSAWRAVVRTLMNTDEFVTRN